MKSSFSSQNPNFFKQIKKTRQKQLSKMVFYFKKKIIHLLILLVLVSFFFHSFFVNYFQFFSFNTCGITSNNTTESLQLAGQQKKFFLSILVIMEHMYINLNIISTIQNHGLNSGFAKN